MIKDPIISELLSLADYIVFIFLTLLTLGFVLYGNYRKKKITDKDESYLDLMLMGRKLTLPMFIATLVATWYGGVFGVSQIAFENGIFNFVSQGVFWYLTYILFAVFVIKKIKNYNAITLPDLVGQMFGPRSEKLAAVFNILNLVPIVYTISLGLVLNMVFGIDLSYGIIFGVLFVLSYSFIGGFRSIVYSDIFQFFIMIISIISVLLFSYFKYGTEVFSVLPDSFFHPLGTFTLLETFAWGLIALSTLVDPNFYQRCFAAENFETAKKGIFLSTIVWIIFDLSLTFGAIYARSILPDASPQNGYFIYALQLLPDGFRGFFLAGICATILSTLDSYIFLAGSTISHDLLPKRFQGKMWTHNIGILSVALLSICLANFFEGNIKNVWKTLGSLSSSGLLIPILSGYLLKKKMTDTAFVISSLAGALGAMYWRLSGAKYEYNLDEIYIGMSLSLISIIIFYFSSNHSKELK